MRKNEQERGNLVKRKRLEKRGGRWEEEKSRKRREVEDDTKGK